MCVWGVLTLQSIAASAPREHRGTFSKPEAEARASDTHTMWTSRSSDSGVLLTLTRCLTSYSAHCHIFSCLDKEVVGAPVLCEGLLLLHAPLHAGTPRPHCSQHLERALGG